jgi:transcriptional regulator GlxA family with amidase domain
VLYVDDDPIITSAGTAAGIDACLYILRKEFGAAVANAVARRMVVPPHRSGGQAQYVEAPVAESSTGGDLAHVLEWAQRNLMADLTVETLAAQAVMSPRTFARRFREVTGTTPYRWLLDQRLLLAEQLLEDTDLSVDEVAGGPAGRRRHAAPPLHPAAPGRSGASGHVHGKPRRRTSSLWTRRCGGAER